MRLGMTQRWQGAAITLAGLGALEFAIQSVPGGSSIEPVAAIPYATLGAAVAGGLVYLGYLVTETVRYLVHVVVHRERPEGGPPSRP